MPEMKRTDRRSTRIGGTKKQIRDTMRNIRPWIGHVSWLQGTIVVDGWDWWSREYIRDKWPLLWMWERWYWFTCAGVKVLDHGIGMYHDGWRQRRYVFISQGIKTPIAFAGFKTTIWQIWCCGQDRTWWPAVKQDYEPISAPLKPSNCTARCKQTAGCNILYSTTEYHKSEGFRQP